MILQSADSTTVTSRQREVCRTHRHLDKGPLWSKGDISAKGVDMTAQSSVDITEPIVTSTKALTGNSIYSYVKELLILF